MRVIARRTLTQFVESPQGQKGQAALITTRSMLQWWIMSELRPIRSNEDYENALTLLKQLWGAPDGSPEADKLDILATLIDAYEASHYPIDLPDPIDAILFRMEQQGLSRKDLEPILGSRGRIAEILNPRRSLSK
ncbi:transcriptional regulator [Rhizobium sullae]|uniref:helix-turn-helix domain-containing protein n=1 Tax=Rhizobium sullae TaxID=50338 RepID=UPI00315D9FEA